MTAKEYLQQIKKIDTQIKNKLVELEQAESIGIGAGVVRESIARLQSEKAEIIEAIEKLPEAEYDVLHKVYVQGETLYEVASERKISYSLAATIHGRALKRLENIAKSP